jgi:hypothetical protein
MAVWNTAYDAAPAGTDLIQQGDDAIRSTRVEVRTRAEKEHAWANGGPDDGYLIEGAGRAFWNDSNPANLNSAATPSGGGGAALSSANSRGRLAAYTSTGGYGLRVYDGTVWREVQSYHTRTSSTTNYSDTFSTAAAFLQNSAGSADYSLAVTVPAVGTWDLRVTVRGTIKNSAAGASRVGCVQLVYDTGGAVTAIDQTHMSLDNNMAGSYTLEGIFAPVAASTTYTLRVRGFTSANNFRWNETTTNPAAAEFATPYTRMILELRRR